MASLIGKGIRKQKDALGALGGVTKAGHKLGRTLAPATALAQERLVERLDARREQLASMLSVVATGLEGATRHLPGPFPQKALGHGRRLLRDVSTRLQKESGEDLVRGAHEALQQHPVVGVAGLFGAGLLAGRMFRASGMVENVAGGRK